MPSWSQLVCQLCFPASLQCATLPGTTNAGHNQHRKQPAQGTTNAGHPHKSQLENSVAWENLPTGHTVGGGTRVGDMSMRESTPVAGCCCKSSSSSSSSRGAAAGYQCGFCVDAAGPAVQVLGHRVALR